MVNIIIRGHRGAIVHRHNIGTTHCCGQRVPATHYLAHRTQVGRYAVIFLSATVGQAESCDHFVEDEQQVGVSGEFPETGQKARNRGQRTLHRLYDYGGNLILMGVDDCGGGFQIVKLGYQHQVIQGARDAAAVGFSLGKLVRC